MKRLFLLLIIFPCLNFATPVSTNSSTTFIAKTTIQDICSVTQAKGDIDLTVDHRLLSKEGHKEIKEDTKRNTILVESVSDVVTNDGVSLTGDQADGKTSLLDHIDEDQKYFTATKNFVNDPANKEAVEALTNPNATPQEKQAAYTALANNIAQEMGVTPAEAKLIVDSKYQGAFHKDGESGTIYVNDLANDNSAQAVNTVGHETTHSVDYQNDRDIAKTDGYDGNREAHATLMGDHTEDYMEYQYSDNGYSSLSGTKNNNIGTNPVNGYGGSRTVIKNTAEFQNIDPSKLDHMTVTEAHAEQIRLKQMGVDSIMIPDDTSPGGYIVVPQSSSSKRGAVSGAPKDAEGQEDIVQMNNDILKVGDLVETGSYAITIVGTGRIFYSGGKYLVNNAGKITEATAEQIGKLKNYYRNKGTSVELGSPEVPNTHYPDVSDNANNKVIKSKNKPPQPLAEAEGRAHTIIEKPGTNGQYTTYYENGTWKQYRGTGKAHYDKKTKQYIERPNIKEPTININKEKRYINNNKPQYRKPEPNEIP